MPATTAWGWNVGALFTLSPSTKVGVSYRSKIKHELEGRPGRQRPCGRRFAPALTTGSAKASVDLPDTFILSVVQNLNDKWEMLGDISWTGWSSIPKVDIVRTSGSSTVPLCRPSTPTSVTPGVMPSGPTIV
jgi:long-chain fatty acid transport protein